MFMNYVLKKESNGLEWLAQTGIEVMASVRTISGQSQC